MPVIGTKVLHPWLHLRQVRVRPRINLWGIQYLYTVEIWQQSAVRWTNIFYGDEESATALTDAIRTATTRAMQNAIAHTVQALSERAQRVERDALSAIERATEPLHLIAHDARKLFDLTRYLRGSTLSHWQREMKRMHRLAHVPTLAQLLGHPFIACHTAAGRASALISEVEQQLAPDQRLRHQHNDRHMALQKERFGRLFHHVESQPLTEEQIEAALIFDDANITIAAAGSGKTSVMVAKVAYALEAGLFKEDEILALAYNADAADELQKRLNARLKAALKRPVRVEARTFHSLGLKLLSRAERGIDWAIEPINGIAGKRRFFAAFDSLVKESPSFRDNLLQWLAFTRFPLPKLEPGDDDLEENERRYHDACRIQLGKKLSGQASKYAPIIPTLDASLKVRSFEEAAIANWLILHQMKHGVDFFYEMPRFGKLAEKIGVPLSKKGKQLPYKPDFCYPHPAEKNHFFFHEHFGLDENGKAPAFMGGEKYVENAARKRAVFHNLYGWVEKTPGGIFPFFETTSAQFRNGTLFNHLAQELTRRGITIKPLDHTKEQALFAEFRESNQMEDLFIAFVSLYRESGLSEREVYERAANSDDALRSTLFLKIVFELIHAVEREYAKHSMIDFSDMLKRGANAVLAGLPTKFKLILVDEFQDIARLRMNLVHSLANKHPDSILFFVGDDWQAINRFSGSDIAIFHSYVPELDSTTGSPKRHRASECGRSAHAVLLSKTFRCAQGIADVSRAIVMQNGEHIPKPVVAELLPEIANTIRVVEHLDNAEARLEALRNELSRLAQLPRPVDRDGNERLIKVFILTRNMVNTAVPEGFEKARLHSVIDRFKDRLEIVRDTLHRSKGLEADYTIIGGMDSGYRGFPSEHESDPLLELLLPPQRDPLDDERRLFYVGLTRSKRQTILLTAATRPSEYILELERLAHLKDRIDWRSIGITRRTCPRCRRGTVQEPRYPGDLRRCSRQPRCGYGKCEGIDHYFHE